MIAILFDRDEDAENDSDWEDEDEEDAAETSTDLPSQESDKMEVEGAHDKENDIEKMYGFDSYDQEEDSEYGGSFFHFLVE